MFVRPFVCRTNRELSTCPETTTRSTHTSCPLSRCGCHKLLASGCERGTRGRCISSRQRLCHLSLLDASGTSFSSAGPVCFIPVARSQQFLSFHAFPLLQGLEGLRYLPVTFHVRCHEPLGVLCCLGDALPEAYW